MSAQFVVTPRDAHKWAENIIDNMYILKKAAIASGFNDRWLDRQFVITIGNLSDLSGMFEAMARVEAKKQCKGDKPCHE